MRQASIVLGMTILCLAVLLGCAPKSEEAAPAEEPAAAAAAPEPVRFASAIEPIVAERCAECHVENAKGDFSLASLADAMEGGKSGAVIVPGDAEASRLYKLVSGQLPDKGMPPKGDPLTPDQVAAIKTWIDGGAQ